MTSDNHTASDRLTTYSFEREYAAFVDALLASQNVQVAFDHDVRKLTADDLRIECTSARLDLRGEPCLTIDCSDTKDMDDAISVARSAGGYLLGVHIADVGAYVRPGSALDAAAMRRGTSHYLPDRTVPMLPPLLSDDLCSLNPNVARNVISVLIDLDSEANVLDYSVERAVIRSCVKGTYEEVESILAYRASEEVMTKYAGVVDMLPVMAELSQKLLRPRVAHGARIDVGPVARIAVRDGDVEVSTRVRGLAETIVEEFMVLANRLVADYFLSNGLPGIFRTQEEHGSLAGYQVVVGRHEDLALDRYLHFTSPIRRLADLKVHQVLNAHLAGGTVQAIRYALSESVALASDVAQRRARCADNVALACERRALARYYQTHAADTFTGSVVTNRNGCTMVLVDETASTVALLSRMRTRPGQRLRFRVETSVDLRRAYAVSVHPLGRAA